MKMQGLLTCCTLLIASLITLVAGSGCQATNGGQEPPQTIYGGDDDIQFFPSGPEFLLPEQQSAIDEYRAQQAGTDRD